MRNYAKVGGRKGMPGYRTPSRWRHQAGLRSQALKARSFKERVIRAVKNIPRGQTLSYKAVADLAGSEKASRAVGNILKQNYDPDIPCHRVIRSDGKTGGYNRGAEEKRKILAEEGAIN